MAHRGNTGSHKGKRKLTCLCGIQICALLLFFSVFSLWHKENSTLKSLNIPRIFDNRKIDLQSHLFGVNITHHDGEFFCFVSCVHRKILKSKTKKSKDLGGNVLCMIRQNLFTWD